MPGELLPTMAAPSVSKAKLPRGKSDLYLIVSTQPEPSQLVVLITCQSEEDTIYEQDILRDPGTTKPWLAYIEFKFQHGNIQEQAYVLERACKQLPRSYKLWKMVCLCGAFSKNFLANMCSTCPFE
jgi:pre-mRNA-splicing factor SYF1